MPHSVCQRCRNSVALIGNDSPRKSGTAPDHFAAIRSAGSCQSAASANSAQITGSASASTRACRLSDGWSRPKRFNSAIASATDGASLGLRPNQRWTKD